MCDTNNSVARREIGPADMVETDINMTDANMTDVSMVDASNITSDRGLQKSPQQASQRNPRQNAQQKKKKSGPVPEIPEFRRAYVDENARYLAMHLPPMHRLEEIFSDLVVKALSLGFDKVLEHLGERPLRIATVCSGTESPILAMEMLQQGKLSVFFLVHSSFACLSRISTCPGRGIAGPWLARNHGFTIPLRSALQVSGFLNTAPPSSLGHPHEPYMILPCPKLLR